MLKQCQYLNLIDGMIHNEPSISNHTECLSEVTYVKLARLSACFANRILYDTENMARHIDSLHTADMMSGSETLIKGYVVLQLHWVHLHWVMYFHGLLQLEKNFSILEF